MSLSTRRIILAGAAAAGLSMPALSTPALAQDSDVKIAAISGYFAQGFGVSIVQGLERAEADFGVDVQLIDTGNRSLDYEEQFRNVAESGEYDLVFVMGFELVDALLTTAEAYPDQRFVFIDGVLDNPNLIYANFAEHEGSFLAGAFATLVTEQGSAIERLTGASQIGFVGGIDIPVIRNFLTGYEQGAAYVTPDVTVSSVFAGTFDDPARGSELAMTLYNDGSDIVFNVAGPTGEGVLQASAMVDKYSIGVDIDQCGVAPGNVIASMLKHADIAVYSLIKDEVEGRTVQPGTYTFDVETGGVELLICPDVASLIPSDILDSVEAIRAGIAAGEIEVESVK